MPRLLQKLHEHQKALELEAARPNLEADTLKTYQRLTTQLPFQISKAETSAKIKVSLPSKPLHQLKTITWKHLKQIGLLCWLPKIRT